MLSGRHPATFFPLLLAALLAAMSYWLELATRPPAADDDGAFRHDPDYYVDNIQMKSYDAAGELVHSMSAQRMLHYPDDDSTLVEEPAIVYHQQPLLRMSARIALLDKDEDRIRLRQQVLLQRSGDAGVDLQVSGDGLDIHGEDEIIISNTPVLISDGAARLSGEQLRIDRKNGVWSLQGEVRGLFPRQTVSHGAKS